MTDRRGPRSCVIACGGADCQSAWQVGNLPHRSRPQGFTLIEVLLTLALLVVLAALSWPLLERPFANRRLKVAADQVRTAWVHARVQAMDNDRTYVFRYTPDGPRYRVECRSAAAPTVDLTVSDSSGLSTSMAPPSAGLPTVQGALPEGITFVGSETLADTRAAAAAAEIDALPTDGAAWSEPILFYPDGTTSTARLRLRNPRGVSIELSLRGLTGVVTLSEVQTTEEPLP